MATFNESVRFKDWRYEVSVPWKENASKLVSDEAAARARLFSLQRRLDTSPSLKDRYNQVFIDMENSGIIEEVTETEVSYPTFYLPHHPVIKESSSTTKIRPVFDASAVGPNGISLNDCVETGPAMMPDLVGILMRFRRWPVALTADITKAFLQISLRRED